MKLLEEAPCVVHYLSEASAVTLTFAAYRGCRNAAGPNCGYGALHFLMEASPGSGPQRNTRRLAPSTDARISIGRLRPHHLPITFIRERPNQPVGIGVCERPGSPSSQGNPRVPETTGEDPKAAESSKGSLVRIQSARPTTRVPVDVEICRGFSLGSRLPPRPHTVVVSVFDGLRLMSVVTGRGVLAARTVPSAL